MKVAIGCDHGGWVLKETVINTLKELGAEVVDFGTNSASVGYPEFARAVRRGVERRMHWASCLRNGHRYVDCGKQV